MKKEIEVSDARIKQVEDIRKIIEKIKLEVEDSFKVYEFTKKRLIDYEEKHLPRIDELISIIYEKYQKEELSGRELLRAEQSRIAIHENYFIALYDFEDAFSDLERAVGIALVEENEQPQLDKNSITPF